MTIYLYHYFLFCFGTYVGLFPGRTTEEPWQVDSEVPRARLVIREPDGRRTNGGREEGGVAGLRCREEQTD